MDHPYLYTLVSEVLENGRVADRYSTSFGVRTIAFDKQKGFLLNGVQRKLHGVCLHHDLGALGAAVNRRATERQLQILQAAGVNAMNCRSPIDSVNHRCGRDCAWR
jgi:beta-galactosidase